MKLEHNTLQVEIPDPHRGDILRYAARRIDALYVKQLEKTPHVTIKYGIDTDDPELVAKAICPFIPIRMMLGMNNLFPAVEIRPVDVLYIEVYGESLKRLRRKVEENVPVIVNDFPYEPHLTLAYLDAWAGLQYVGRNGFNNLKIICEEVVFQLKSKRKYIIDKNGNIRDYEVNAV